MTAYIVVFGYILPSWVSTSITYLILRETGNSWFSAKHEGNDYKLWKELGLLSMIPIINLILLVIVSVAILSDALGLEDMADDINIPRSESKRKQPEVSLVKKKRSKRSHISNGRSTMCGMSIDKTFEESDSHENLCPACHKMYDGGLR